MFINVRGCNGSGKTTVLRKLFLRYMKQPNTAAELTKVEVPNHRPIPVTLMSNGVAFLGDYFPREAGLGNITAGCDKIKTQEATKAALLTVRSLPGVVVTLFEGVMISTIHKPWAEFAWNNPPFVWAFLDTPLYICQQRITDRNGGRPYNEALVENKWRGINRILEKVKSDPNQTVLVLPWEEPVEPLSLFIQSKLGICS